MTRKKLYKDVKEFIETKNYDETLKTNILNAREERKKEISPLQGMLSNVRVVIEEMVEGGATCSDIERGFKKSGVKVSAQTVREFCKLNNIIFPDLKKKKKEDNKDTIVMDQKGQVADKQQAVK